MCITPGKCQSILSYYDGPEMKKEYGKIDLDTCEEVTSNLDTDNYHFVFAIKTTFKNQKRTYLLAADTNEDITKWMKELGKLLNLADSMSLMFHFIHKYFRKSILNSLAFYILQ